MVEITNDLEAPPPLVSEVSGKIGELRRRFNAVYGVLPAYDQRQYDLVSRVHL